MQKLAHSRHVSWPAARTAGPVLLMHSMQSYERATIEAWFTRCKAEGWPCTDPLTRQVGRGRGRLVPLFTFRRPRLRKVTLQRLVLAMPMRHAAPAQSHDHHSKRASAGAARCVCTRAA